MDFQFFLNIILPIYVVYSIIAGVIFGGLFLDGAVENWNKKQITFISFLCGLITFLVCICWLIWEALGGEES